MCRDVGEQVTLTISQGKTYCRATKNRAKPARGACHVALDPGALPPALLLPYANLFWTGVLAAAAGLFYGFSFALGQ